MLLLAVTNMQGQKIIRDMGGMNRNFGGGSSGSGKDSLQHRNKFEDSITISFRYLDSARNYKIDSSISDYGRRFPVPYSYHYMGNVGNAAHSILFQPQGKAGWDAGFHAYDVYKWSLDKVRFFTTTRPYTELGYTIGSQQQQMVEVLHTQNLKPYWNVLLQYRLINAPGFFKNQRTAHNNYLLTSWYQSPNKRYNNFVVLVGNKLQGAENGGIVNVNDLEDPTIPQRFLIPTHIGNNVRYASNPFSGIETGNVYNEFNALLRQQYDIGRKDSLVTDSTVIPLFYPRLRLEHTFTYGEYKYTFNDKAPDSSYYQQFYHTDVGNAGDEFLRRDRWKELKNDFSIYQFPDAKNVNQFIKIGAEYQQLTGTFINSRTSFLNVSLHGEYRNRTRNQKWDATAAGRLYLAGYNSGDYEARISLQRLLSSKLGSLQLGFENRNRTPSFVYDSRSSFYLDNPKPFYKENTTHFFGTLFNPALKLQLGADYYFVTNYLYFSDYYKPRQENDLFNLLRLNALKTVRLSRYWHWYAEVYLQQKAGNASVHLPLFFTRNRVEYEGNFGFKNLTVALGTEWRYHTPYKADNYSAVIGQFSYQDTVLIKNRPDIHVFFNFRIRGFKAYVRAENLNTFRLKNGAGFKQQNLAAPGYPYPGLVMRFGIFWSFVN